MKKKVVKKAELVTIKIFCPKLEKEIEVNFVDCSFSGHESECEMCGSHGDVKVYVKCECGSNHDIEITSW